MPPESPGNATPYGFVTTGAARPGRITLGCIWELGPFVAHMALERALPIRDTSARNSENSNA